MYNLKEGVNTSIHFMPMKDYLNLIYYLFFFGFKLLMNHR